MSDADTPRTATLSLAEVRDELGISRNALWRWMKQGKLRKIPGTNRVTRKELERFLDDAAKPPSPEDRRRGPYQKTRDMQGE